MTTLTMGQMEAYARSAGLSADAAKVAAAIGMAESSGRTTAHNALPPDDSYGIWQINMLGSLGPDRRSKLGISSNSALYDPAVNARAMAMISGGGSSFAPWSTYGSGAYKKYLGGSATATSFGPEDLLDPFNILPDEGDGSIGDGLADVGGGALSGVASLAELAIGAAKWMSDPQNWARVAQVATGGVLVVAGLVVAAKGSAAPLVKAAAKTASAVTPQGRVVSAVSAATKSKAAGSGGKAG